MKKIYKLIIILLSLTPLFSNEDLLEISTESVDSLFIDEIEYSQSKYFKDGFEFSEGLEIYSNSDEIHIYLNGKQYFSSQLKFNNLEVGLYNIKFKKNGYKTIDRWIDIVEGKRVIITVTLAREFGYLNVESISPNYQIYLNNFLVDNNIAVPTGYYVLKVRSFGYTEVIKNISIIDSLHTYEKIKLEEAAFVLEGLKIEKPRFNPFANEGFKTNKLTIQVNAPGSGILKIKNSNGIELYTKNLEFKSWLTEIEYSGLDQNNNYLNDGRYILQVNSEKQESVGEFIIDSTLFHRSLSLSRGFSGLLAVPTAETNNYPIRQTSFSIGSSLNSPIISLPVSFQSSILPNLNLHTGFDLGLNINDQANTSLYLGFFYGINFDLIMLGMNINYRFDVIQSDLTESSSYHNIILNIPLTFNLNSYYLSIAPEYKYTINGDNTIGSGIGFHYDNQRYRFGISGRVDIIDTIQKYYFGIEGSFLLPNSQSFLGLSLTGNEDLDLTLMMNLSMLY